MDVMKKLEGLIGETIESFTVDTDTHEPKVHIRMQSGKKKEVNMPVFSIIALGLEPDGQGGFSVNSAHYTGLEVEASDLGHTLPKVRNLLRDTKGLTHLREVNLWGLDESRYYLGKAGKPWFQVEAKPEDKLPCKSCDGGGGAYSMRTDKVSLCRTCKGTGFQS